MGRPSIALWLLLALPLWAQGGTPPPGTPAASPPACGSGFSPYDRSLFRDAGYRFGQDAVLDLAGNALTCEEALPILEGLRGERRRQALAALAGVQQEFLDHNGKLPDGAAAKARGELARDWELIPSDIRDGMNALLVQQSYKAVRAADLSVIEQAGKAWEKGDPLDGNDPDAVSAGRPPDSADVKPVPPAELEAARRRFAPPSPQELPAKFQEIEAAAYRDAKSGELKPYPEGVKKSLKEVIRYAASEDGEAVLRVLRTQHPPILISNAEISPFSQGTTFSPAVFPDADTPPEHRHTRVALWEYEVDVRLKGNRYVSLPDFDPDFYKDKGLPVPDLKALDPAAKPEPDNVEQQELGAWETFPDGSARWRPTPEGRAEMLLHELLHAATYGEGGGANSFASEMRSYLAQQRFLYNRDEASGRTDKPDYSADNLWLRHPISYRDNILADYMSPTMGGEVEPDAVSVAQQMARDERILKAGGEEFEKIRAKEIRRLVKMQVDGDRHVVDALRRTGLLGPIQAWKAKSRLDKDEEALLQDKDFLEYDYRRKLEWEQERLPEDQALEIRVLQDDILWHLLRGRGYRRGKDSGKGKP